MCPALNNVWLTDRLCVTHCSTWCKPCVAKVIFFVNVLPAGVHFWIHPNDTRFRKKFKWCVFVTLPRSPNSSPKTIPKLIVGEFEQKPPTSSSVMSLIALNVVLWPWKGDRGHPNLITRFPMWVNMKIFHQAGVELGCSLYLVHGFQHSTALRQWSQGPPNPNQVWRPSDAPSRTWANRKVFLSTSESVAVTVRIESRSSNSGLVWRRSQDIPWVIMEE